LQKLSKSIIKVSALSTLYVVLKVAFTV